MLSDGGSGIFLLLHHQAELAVGGTSPWSQSPPVTGVTWGSQTGRNQALPSAGVYQLTVSSNVSCCHLWPNKQELARSAPGHETLLTFIKDAECLKIVR